MPQGKIERVRIDLRFPKKLMTMVDEYAEKNALKRTHAIFELVEKDWIKIKAPV